MRKLLYIISVALILGLAGGCDRKGAQLDRTFDRADALMTDHPDSALAIMQTVDTAGLSRPRLARYALLLTNALRKNRREPKNDTLIKIAVDYYCGRGNTREMESLYFYGVVLYNKDSMKTALPYALLAYDMADEQHNWFYKGMSARLLSDLYKFLYIFPEQKRFAQLSKEAFLKYEKERGIDNRYSAWMDCMLAEATLNNGEYEEGLSVCEGIDKNAISKSKTLRHEVWTTKAAAYNRLGQPHHSILIYDSLINDGYKMEGYNWNHLASYYYNAGDLAKSRAALDSAKNNMKYDQDTLYVAHLEYILSDSSNNQQSKYALENYNNEIAKTTNRLIANSPVHNITESYHKKSQEYKRHIRSQKLLFWLSVSVLIILIAFVSVLLSRRIRLKRREIGYLNVHKSQLLQKTSELSKDNRDLSEANRTLRDHNAQLWQSASELSRNNRELIETNADLTTENTHLKEQVDSAMEKGAGLEMQIEELIEEITAYSKIIDEYGRNTSEIRRKSNKNDKEHIKQINKFCTLLYQSSGNDLKENRIVKDLYKSIVSENSLMRIDEAIDGLSKGFIDTILLNFPNMHLSRLRLVRYLYAGFSLETMMILFRYDVNGRNKIDSAKSDLKRRILDKKDWTGITAETVLRKLGYQLK